MPSKVPLILVAALFCTDANGALLFFNSEMEWRQKIETTAWSVGTVWSEGPVVNTTGTYQGGNFLQNPPWAFFTDNGGFFDLNEEDESVTTVSRQGFGLGMYENNFTISLLYIRAFGGYFSAEPDDWRLTISQRPVKGVSGQFTQTVTPGFMGWVAENPEDDIAWIRFLPVNGTVAQSPLVISGIDGVAVPEPAGISLISCLLLLSGIHRRR